MIDDVEKEYRSLFSLPSLRVILVFSFIISVFFGIIMSLVLVKQVIVFRDLLSIISILFSTFVIIIVFSMITLLIEGDERNILDFRRLVGLYTLAVSLAIPVLFLSYIFRILNFLVYENLIFVAIGIGISYSTLALASIVKIGYLKPIILSNSFFSTILFVQSLVYSSVEWFLGRLYVIFSMITIYTFISLITLYAVSLLGKDKNFDALDAFRGFMAAWLSKKADKLEKIFNRLGTQRNILMGIIKFRRKDGSLKAAWIVSNIHPGPFLNVASADIPYYVSKELEDKIGLESMSFLHGTCSHYNNLTSLEEKKKLVQEILDVLNLNGKRGKTYHPTIISNGDINIYYQILGGLSLGVIFSEKLSLDDISYQLGLLVHEKYSQLGKDVILCDAHSSLDKNLESTKKDIKPWDPVGSKILAMIDSALESPVSKGYEEILLGVHKVRNCTLGIDDGLGSDGVASYVIGIEDKRYLIVVLDSNNLSLGLHSYLRQKFMELFGFDHVIILSTDTHEVNAVSPKEGSYPILSRHNLPKLFNCIKQVVEKAIEKMEPVSVEGFTFYTKNTKILGEETYFYLKNLIKQGIHTFKFVYNIGLILGSIIVFLVSFLI